MRHEVKKITKMVDEIVTFCICACKAPRSEIAIERFEESYRLEFVFRGSPLSDQRMKQLQKTLAVKRNPELEDYYWQLAGETDSGNELELVAMMSDEAMVVQENGNLMITLVRKI